MKRMILALVLSVCAPALAQTPSDAPDMWRMHTEHLAADRVLVRQCLDADSNGCERVVQDVCLAAYSEDDRVPALERQCDWRAMAAWEEEMTVTLAKLGKHVDAHDLDASQRAWQASMLADVGMGVNMVSGGSLEGPVGAHIRARAEARRVQDLEELAATFE